MMLQEFHGSNTSMYGVIVQLGWHGCSGCGVCNKNDDDDDDDADDDHFVC